ncbi:MAG: GIY-YIG nuclease family protein [Ruminococcus sp.]|nr:GIY-YIG nuclease family protein [Ruminococcus sp.]
MDIFIEILLFLIPCTIAIILITYLLKKYDEKFALKQQLEFEQKQKIRQELEEKIDKLTDGSLAMSPKEFMDMRNKRLYSAEYEEFYAHAKNFEGIYILHNIDKDKHYVGQSIRVLDRVNSHFTGKGNADVYFDYRSGDNFTIRMIALKNSGFSSLNKLEKDAILRYNAYTKGYNKTRGNG